MSQVEVLECKNRWFLRLNKQSVKSFGLRSVKLSSVVYLNVEWNAKIFTELWQPREQQLHHVLETMFGRPTQQLLNIQVCLYRYSNVGPHDVNAHGNHLIDLHISRTQRHPLSVLKEHITLLYKVPLLQPVKTSHAHVKNGPYNAF
jgi:hypothetical protein